MTYMAMCMRQDERPVQGAAADGTAEKMNFCRAAVTAIAEEMDRDPAVFMIGEDIGGAGGAFGGSRGLLERFGPTRVRDTPISENAIAGLAVGAALTGARPIVEIMFMDFIGLAMEQIVNQAAKIHYMFAGAFTVPLVVRTMCGAGMGTGPHHSQSLEAWLAHVPGLKVVMPSTPRDAKGLLKSAIRDENPVIVIEHLALYRQQGDVPKGEFIVPIGVADVRRAGRDISVIAPGLMTERALKAAEVLAQEGIEAEVIDPRSICPMDTETILQSVRKTGRALVVTTSYGAFGIGAEIAARIQEEAFFSLDAPVQRLSPPFVPAPFAAERSGRFLPDGAAIAAAVRKVVGGYSVLGHAR